MYAITYQYYENTLYLVGFYHSDNIEEWLGTVANRYNFEKEHLFAKKIEDSAFNLTKVEGSNAVHCLA